MRVQSGRPACRVMYDWNGRPSFWGARAGSCLLRAEQLARDPRATNIRIRISGKEYAPEDVEIIKRPHR